MKVQMWNKTEGAPLLPVERVSDLTESESEDEKTSEPDEESDVEETTEIDGENLQVTDVTDSGSEDENTYDVVGENLQVIQSDSEDMVESDSDSDEPRKEVVREEVEILEDLQMTVQDAGLDFGKGILFEQKPKIKK